MYLSPGTYEFDVARNRKVQMFHSFGGPTHMIPIVEMKCVLDNDNVNKIVDPNRELSTNLHASIKLQIFMLF